MYWDYLTHHAFFTLLIASHSTSPFSQHFRAMRPPTCAQVRATVPKMNLDDVFTSKEEIARAVK